MTILEAINKILGLALPNVPSLKLVLQQIEAKFPDTKTQLDPIIAVLDAPLDVAQLAASLPDEVLNIIKLHIDGKPHSGDAI